MMDLVLKNKSGLGYAQDLVVHIVVYGISVYHIVYDVPLSVWDKKYEITSDTLNFITHVEMTKELKIPDAFNDDNSVTKNVFDDKTESVYYYCNNLGKWYNNNNGKTVGFVTSGANVLISNCAHFSFKMSTGHITFDISGIYEIYFKDGYKGTASNIRMHPGSFNPNIVFVYIEGKQ